MVEERARQELGMVKPNEVFVQIAQVIDGCHDRAAAASGRLRDRAAGRRKHRQDRARRAIAERLRSAAWPQLVGEYLREWCVAMAARPCLMNRRPSRLSRRGASPRGGAGVAWPTPRR